MQHVNQSTAQKTWLNPATIVPAIVSQYNKPTHMYILKHLRLQT